jgi:hypothetical protein
MHMHTLDNHAENIVVELASGCQVLGLDGILKLDQSTGEVRGRKIPNIDRRRMERALRLDQIRE